MDAKDYLVNHVLGDGRRFMVPIYQRQYQWGEDRLTTFWEDVAAKADGALDGSARFQHYMGALILAPGGDGYAVGVTPRVQVVDGQQRLTTFQILLAALRESARARGAEQIVRRIDDYLFNPKKAADTDPLSRFKLCPTPADRALFHDLVDKHRDAVRAAYAHFYFANGKFRKGGTPKALAAYEFFLDRIDLYAQFGIDDPALRTVGDVDEDDPERCIERLDALLQALLSGMKLVVITLDESDDAQVIFETLNSQGQPLLAMDLVRNNIFHRAEAQGETVEKLYEELWGSFDAPWWREDAPRARPKRPRIDHFLAHVLTAQSGQATSMRELYAEYRAFARPKGKARFERVEDELRMLTAYAPTYETLEGRIDGDPSIARLGRKLAAWEVTTAYPVAFQLADAAISDAERAQIATLLYSYIVRRALCGLTPKNLNGVFQRISDRFIKQGVSVETLAVAFGEQTGPAVRFPDDAELRSGIVANPVYSWLGAGRLADALWELELASRSAFMEMQAKPENLWIEHVLPRSWTMHWPMADGSAIEPGAADPRAADRNRLLDTLGNLTLVTSGLNISLGNENFEAKLAKLKQHTLLAMNHWILQREHWDEAIIHERGTALGELAVRVWPRPS